MSPDLFEVAAADGTRLAVAAHESALPGPVAVLAHGIASHMGWYHELGAALAAEGVTTWITDRRGCGRSGGERGHMRSWRVVVDDVVRVALAARERHPQRPLHAIGVSLGAAFSLAASIREPDLFRTQALLSPGLASAIRIPWHRRIRLIGRSTALPRTMFDVPFGLGAFTDRADWQQALDKDPLRTRRVTARFLTETFLLQRDIRRRAASLRVPILALMAGRDALIDNELVIAGLSRAGSSSVRIEVFEGATHVIPAAVPRAELVSRLAGWFRGELPPVAERVFVARIPPFPASAGAACPPPRLGG